jgi:hypothetical protein
MIVNSKIAMAFVAGAVLATGVVYVALRPPARPRPAPAAVAAVSAPAVEPQPAVSQHPQPAAEPPPAISEAPPAPASKPAPAVRPRKPSPMPPAHPAEIAQATPPADNLPASVRSDPSQEAAAPATAPPAAEPMAPQPPEATAEAPAPEPAPPPVNRVTLKQGLIINVRLSEALSTDKNEKGDAFFATLDAPLAADGFVIAERGARAEGRIVDVVRGGRGNGAAHLALQLTGVHTSDGQRVPLETATFDRKAETSGGEDAAKVGGGAILGAVIGAVAGGGKGAGIGAMAGGAAGAGGAVLTHGRTAKLPTETRISFRLQRDVTVTERPR